MPTPSNNSAGSSPRSSVLGSAFESFRHREGQPPAETAGSVGDRAASLASTTGSTPATGAEQTYTERSSFENNGPDSDVEEIEREHPPRVNNAEQGVAPRHFSSWGVNTTGVQIGHMAPGSEFVTHDRHGTSRFIVPGQPSYAPPPAHASETQGGHQPTTGSPPQDATTRANVVVFGGGNTGAQIVSNNRAMPPMQFGGPKGNVFERNGKWYPMSALNVYLEQGDEALENVQDV